MPYHAEWYLRNRVIDARVWGKVSVEDMELHCDTCVLMLTEAQANDPDSVVHVVFDASKAESIPPLYQTITQGVGVLKFRNRGLFCLITRNHAIRSI